MSGASIETTLELWAAELREAKRRMRPLFTQGRVAASAGLFLDDVLGANATDQFASWGRLPVVAGTAEAIARGLDASGWRRLSAGEGTKGARLYDWVYLELADLEADEFNPTLSGTWTRGLLIRRNIADGALAYFSTWCPQGTGVETLATVEGSRWSVEDAFETAKTALRPRPQRDPLLAWLAPSYEPGHAGLRHPRAGAPARQPGTPKNTAAAAAYARPLIRWSIQEIRRLAMRLAQRRIRPAHVIAWSVWRRAHQAAAQRSHLKRKMQL